MATGRIGVTPTLRTRWSKAPSAGTTSLSGLDDNSVSLVYDVGYEAVYRNGVLLSRTNDYTATTGNSITLIDATIAGDIIEVFANQLLPLTNAIGNGQYTAKGALLSATAASTPAVLTVGSNDQVLTADSSTATGLKWATPAVGGMTLITTLSPSAVSSSSVDNVFTSTYDSYLIVGYITWTDNTNLEMRLRASGSDITTSTYFQDQTSAQGTAGSTWYLADNRGTNVITGFTIGLTNPGNSDYKIGNLQRTINATTGTYTVQGLRNSTLSATDGIKFFPTTGTMTGTIRIYGLAK